MVERKVSQYPCLDLDLFGILLKQYLNTAFQFSLSEYPKVKEEFLGFICTDKRLTLPEHR